ncbi:NADH-quinone oxidoreductase subunit NuoI [bacterium endosymbiont of Pedicinus badii]|uniref:NADH-quinone oxidoreductase subunit NuoI n=1 Tax=bacterium endosymbiont of Pedicinus badii TaxID=1719126 RepID=UPI0009BB9D1B|nr:NADH-quinone oxidoreductase subunit NuoI [bacterium endosymbiont of Pedicinus badii]OQM34450.1 NADH dehydrogenase [bacterium endosymbiont of Pedicinus badii]
MKNLEKFIKNILSVFKTILIIFLQIFKKKVTILYPKDKTFLTSRYRGRIVLTRNLDKTERCVACGLCSVVCPTNCIALQKKEKKGRWYAKFFRINFSRCIFCGFCEEACPTKAIQLIPDFEMSEFERKELVYEKKDLLISGEGKYKNYNFYEISGVKEPKKKKKKNLHKESDFKSILP